MQARRHGRPPTVLSPQLVLASICSSSLVVRSAPPYLRFSRYIWGIIASVNLGGFLADQQREPQYGDSSKVQYRHFKLGADTYFEGSFSVFDLILRYGIDRTKRLGIAMLALLIL